jgi:hypothetical protein
VGTPCCRIRAKGRPTVRPDKKTILDDIQRMVELAVNCTCYNRTCDYCKEQKEEK